jgi:hypothetical protein
MDVYLSSAADLGVELDRDAAKNSADIAAKFLKVKLTFTITCKCASGISSLSLA